MLRRDPLALLGLALLAVLACARGPEEAELVRALEARLEAGFEEGLFSVRSFRRRGSAPVSDIGDGSEGLFVYYDAELAFEREYSLTSWRGLNVGTLAFVLGATEQGISGFSAEGNRKGDVLSVSGRLAWRGAPGGTWEPIDDVTPPPRVEAPPFPVEGTRPGAVLRGVRALIERDPGVPRPPRDAAIVDELERAVERLDLRFARLEGKITLGSGQPPGTYYDFGAAFARQASAAGLPLHNYASEGSVENGFRVQSQLLSFGLVQSDVAETLFQGWVEENQLPQPDLRSVASLWPEAVHLVTLEGSGIGRLADLRGRRVALGQPGSGSRFSAFRVAAAAGLAPGDVPDVREMPLREGVAELEAGSVDALFVTEAIPAPALQELARRRRDVRFVPLQPSTVGTLSDRHFAYYPLTIPARSYPGQVEAVRTVGLASVLITNRRTPGPQVTQVLELLVDGSEALSREYYRAGFISGATMRLGIAVPLHPAAEAFYTARAGKARDPAPGGGI